MSDTLDVWKAELRLLPGSTRAELARFLIDSLEPEDGLDVEAAWEAELTQRTTEIQSGHVVGTPAEQVFAKLRARFP